MLISFEKSLEL